jgi:hypothetical protein
VAFLCFWKLRFANRCSFVTDLDPSSIEALAVTASRSQAPALKDLVYRHLKGKTFIGVTIPVGIISLAQIFQLVVFTDLSALIVVSRLSCFYSRFPHSIFCTEEKRHPSPRSSNKVRWQALETVLAFAAIRV